MMEFNSSIPESELLVCEKGRILMRQGEYGNFAYLLIKGRLQIQRKAEDEQLIIGDVVPYDLVGELSILGDMPRCATVTVIEDSRLLKINKSRLKTIIRRYPDIAEIVIRILCKRIEFNAEKVVESYIASKNPARDEYRQDPELIPNMGDEFNLQLNRIVAMEKREEQK